MSGKTKTFEIFLTILLALIFAYIVAPKTLVSQENGATSMSDFVVYYSVADISNNGNAAKIYNDDLQKETESKIAGIDVRTALPYLYPPYSIGFYAPLNNFGLMNAYYIWGLINAFVSALLLYLVFLKETPANNGMFIYAIFAITSAPWLLNAGLGHPSVLMALGIVGYKLLLKNQQLFLASLLIIICSFKPQLTIAPALFLFINNYNNKLLFATLAAIFIVFLACAFVFGIDIWGTYLKTLLTATGTLTSHMDAALSMANIKAVALHIFGLQNYEAINSVSIILWIISLLFTIYAAFVMRGRNERATNLTFSLIMITACVFGPWTHVPSLVLLIIPAAYLLKYGNKIISYILLSSIFITDLVFFKYIELQPFIWVFVQFIFIACTAYLIKNPQEKNIT